MLNQLATAAARIVLSGHGEMLNVLGAKIAVKSDGDPRHMTFVDHHVPAEYGIPAHVHDFEDEIAFVLEGEIDFTAQGETTRVGPGGFVHLPRGVAHSWRNAGREGRMLVITSPGGSLYGVFRGLDAAARAGQIAPADVGAICAQNDVRML
jgi:mannose-6-phosphate isomerase-like protein (cupin superfamily)